MLSRSEGSVKHNFGVIILRSWDAPFGLAPSADQYIWCYRIWLLSWVFGEEAIVRIRMQYLGLGDPYRLVNIGVNVIALPAEV